MKKHIISILAICNKSKTGKYQFTENALYLFSAWSVYKVEKTAITEKELRDKGFTQFMTTTMTADYERITPNDPRFLKSPLKCIHIPKKEISERRTYLVGTKYIGIDFALAKPFADKIDSIYAPRVNTLRSPVICFDKDGKFLCAICQYMVNQDECKKRFGDGITYLHGKESA